METVSTGLLTALAAARNHKPDGDIANGLGVLALVVLVVVSLIRNRALAKKLSDPADKTVVYTDQIEKISNLSGPGPFLVRVYRQSGNLQQDDRVCDTPMQAIRFGVSTFKRAKIDYVAIVFNSHAKLEFCRPSHDHRGRNEGKKVGGVVIIRMSASQNSETHAAAELKRISAGTSNIYRVTVFFVILAVLIMLTLSALTP